MENIKPISLLRINGKQIVGYKSNDAIPFPLYLAQDIMSAIGAINTSLFIKKVSSDEKMKLKSPKANRMVWMLTNKGLEEALKGNKKYCDVIEKNKTCSSCGKTYPRTSDYFCNESDHECKDCVSLRGLKSNSVKKQATSKIQEKTIQETHTKEVKININGNDVIYLLKNGVALLPLTELVEAIYGEKSHDEMERIRPQISEYITKVSKRKYLSLLGLSIVTKNCEDDLLTESIIKKVLNLPKIEKDPVDTLYDGIVSMSNINDLIKEISEEVNQYDLTKNDILHTLENNDLSEMDLLQTAQKLQALLRSRRTLKIRQIILDEQVTALKNMGFKGSTEAVKEATRIAKVRAEQQISKDHKIYFMRDGSNREEMEAKIRSVGA